MDGSRSRDFERLRGKLKTTLFDFLAMVVAGMPDPSLFNFAKLVNSETQVVIHEFAIGAADQQTFAGNHYFAGREHGGIQRQPREAQQFRT